MNRLLLLLPLLFFACDRCQRTGTPADAGAMEQHTASPDGGRAAAEAADLRSAMLTVFPDFSYTTVLDAYGTFQRVSKPSGATEGDPLDVAEKWFRDQGWKIESRNERTLAATSRPFQVLTYVEKDRLLQSMRIQLGDPGLKALFGAPQSQTTETLAQRFAVIPGYQTVEQTFGFHVTWSATVGRTAFLTQKQVQNLVTAGWEMTKGPPEILHRDAGHESLPESMQVVLDQAETGARLTIVRNAGEVRVDLEQPIKVR